MFRRVLRRLKGWLLALAIISLMATPVAAEDGPVRLTGTQTVLLEAGPGQSLVLATVAVDLALGPRFNVTYVHDAAWEPGGRWRSHDVSVSHYFGGAKDLSATLGVRAKVPVDEDQGSTTTYVLFAWRWGL